MYIEVSFSSSACMGVPILHDSSFRCVSYRCCVRTIIFLRFHDDLQIYALANKGYMLLIVVLASKNCLFLIIITDILAIHFTERLLLTK